MNRHLFLQYRRTRVSKPSGILITLVATACGGQNTDHAKKTAVATSPGVASYNYAPHQYIPPALRDYYNNVLSAAIRAEIASHSPYPADLLPSAEGWYGNWKHAFYPNAPQIDLIAPHERSTLDDHRIGTYRIEPGLRWNDVNKNRLWDPEEDIWNELGQSCPIGNSFQYDESKDQQVYAGAAWETEDCAYSHTKGPDAQTVMLLYNDLDRNKGRNPGEPLWLVGPNTKGQNDKIYYRDANGDGQWSGGEDIWIDVADDGVYNAGVDSQVHVPGSWSTPDGAWGKQKGVYYHVNSQGDFNIWKDSSTDTHQLFDTMRFEVNALRLAAGQPVLQWTHVPARTVTPPVSSVSVSPAGPWDFSFSNAIRPRFNGVIFKEHFVEIANALGASAPPAVDVPFASREAMLNNFPDTDRDDLVDLAVDLDAPENETGAIVFEPEWKRPQVYLPLWSTQGGTTNVHAYVHQGGLENGRSTHKTHPDADEHGIWQVWSLDTRARVGIVLTEAGEHIKRIEVIRPRGNVVVFDFPWLAATSQFSEVGFPIGINERRTYVLRDRSPDRDLDLDYDLWFESGIVHRFDGRSGALQNVVSGFGALISLSKPKAQKYDAELVWKNGRIDEIRYRGLKDPSAAKTTKLVYDGIGADALIQELDKADSDVSMAVDDPKTGSTITWGSGVTMTRSGSSVTRNVPGIGTIKVTTILDADRFLVEQKREVNGGTSILRYQRSADFTRTPSGLPRWGKTTRIEYPDGTWSVREYDPTSGWLTKVVRPFKDATLTHPHSASEVTVYGYDAVAGGDAPSPIDPSSKPRSMVTTIQGQEANRRYFSYSGAKVTVHQAIKAGAAYDDESNIISAIEIGPNSMIETGAAGVRRTLFRRAEKALGKISIPHLAVSNRRQNAFGESIDEGTSLDAFGHVVEHTFPDGTKQRFEGLQWHLGALTVTGRDESVTTYTYYPNGWLETRTRFGVTESFGYDAMANITEISKAGGGLSTTVKSQYDHLGRQIFHQDERGMVTTSSIAGQQRTITYPDGATRVEERYLDGSLKSVSGTSVAQERYDYGVDPVRGYFTEIARETDSGFTDVTREYHDFIGNIRLITGKDQSSVEVVLQEVDINPQGLPVKETDADGVSILASYTPTGSLRHWAIDRNQNGRMEADDDLVLQVATGAASARLDIGQLDQISSHNIRRQRYQDQNGAEIVDVNYQINGEPDAKSTFRQGGGLGQRTVIWAMPHGASVERKYALGLLKSVTARDASGQTIGQRIISYDGLRRPVSIHDSASGTTVFHFDDAGNATEVLLPNGSTIENQYDAMNRITRRKAPDGSIVNIEYTPRGEIKRVVDPSGAAIDLAYDPRGMRNQMIVYPEGLSLPGITTEWTFDPAFGRLQDKRVAGVSTHALSYTPFGRLYKIQKGNQTTKYILGSSGEIAQIDYGDFQETLQYDGRTRLTSVQSVHGTTDYSYTAKGDLASKTIAHIPGAVLEYSYRSLSSSSREGPKVKSGVSLRIDGSIVLSHGYSYDSAGRLSVASDGNSTARYQYSQKTGRLEAVTMSRAGTDMLRTEISGSKKQVSMEWQAPGQKTDFGAHVYYFNNKGQVLRVDQTIRSEDATATPIATYWKHNYDKQGQVTSSRAFWSSDDTPVRGHALHYSYDKRNNRENGGPLGMMLRPTRDYGPANGLNQLQTQKNRGVVFVSGRAANNAQVSISVPGSTPVLAKLRDGEFLEPVAIDNHAGPVAAQIQVRSSHFDAALGHNVLLEQSFSQLVRAGHEAVIFDQQGNKAEDSIFKYEYNGRGQLVSVESTAAIADALKQLVLFSYDPQGRRASKTVYGYDSASNTYSLVRSRTRFVYDGWRLLAEINDANEVTASYLWGSDLSGTFNRAGGIGGLLAVSREGHTYLPMTSRNGNVVGLVDGTDGTLAASYEYGSFGELLKFRSKEGVDPRTSSLLFSTKYYDHEIGLYYYGLRYYDPADGRWLSPDPLGELGGLNLYAFANNDPLNAVDPIGLSPQHVRPPVYNPNLHDVHDRGSALFLAEAATTAYLPPIEARESLQAWGFGDVRFVHSALTDAQAYTAYDPRTNTILVAFRGTEFGSSLKYLANFAGVNDTVDTNVNRVKDVLADFKFLTTDATEFGGGRAHRGFVWQLNSILPRILDHIEGYNADGRETPQVFVGGHSLGGALAALFTAYSLNNGIPVKTTYTIGQPRVGNRHFTREFERLLNENKAGFFRYVNHNDVVSSNPPTLSHGRAGEEYYIDHTGTVREPGEIGVLEKYVSKAHRKSRSNQLPFGILDPVFNHFSQKYLDHIRRFAHSERAPQRAR